MDESTSFVFREPATKDSITTLGQFRHLRTATLSPLTRRIVLTCYNECSKIHVWALGNPYPITTLSGHNSDVQCLGFHPSDTYVSAGASDGSVRIWDLQQGGKVVRTLSIENIRDPITSVLFFPVGRGADILATTSSINMLYLWHIREKKCLKRIDMTTVPARVSECTLGVESYTSFCENQGIEIKELDEFEVKRKVLQHASNRRRLTVQDTPMLRFSPDGKYVLYSRAIAPEEEQLIHDLTILEERQLQEEREGNGESIRCSKSNSSKMLLWTYLHVWEMATGAEVISFAHPAWEGSICSVEFHPEELVVLTCTKMGVVRLWEMEKEYRQLEVQFLEEKAKLKSVKQDVRAFFADASGETVTCIRSLQSTVSDSTRSNEQEVFTDTFLCSAAMDLTRVPSAFSASISCMPLYSSPSASKRDSNTLCADLLVATDSELRIVNHCTQLPSATLSQDRPFTEPLQTAKKSDQDSPPSNTPLSYTTEDQPEDKALPSTTSKSSNALAPRKVSDANTLADVATAQVQSPPNSGVNKVDENSIQSANTALCKSSSKVSVAQQSLSPSTRLLISSDRKKDYSTSILNYADFLPKLQNSQATSVKTLSDLASGCKHDALLSTLTQRLEFARNSKAVYLAACSASAKLSLATTFQAMSPAQQHVTIIAGVLENLMSSNDDSLLGGLLPEHTANVVDVLLPLLRSEHPNTVLVALRTVERLVTYYDKRVLLSTRCYDRFNNLFRQVKKLVDMKQLKKKKPVNYLSEAAVLQQIESRISQSARSVSILYREKCTSAH